MFERSGVEYLAQLEAQLLLVEVAQQELSKAGLVCRPVYVTDRALYG